MRYATLAAALIAATQAVKTSSGQVAAADYSMEGLMAQGENWYTTVAKPFLDGHRDQVALAAKLNAEAEYGPLLETRKIIKEGYDSAVVCETENPCCTVSDVVYINIRTQIEHTQTLITQKCTEWEELERRRLEIETECPDVDFTVVYAEYG